MGCEANFAPLQPTWKFRAKGGVLRSALRRMAKKVLISDELGCALARVVDRTSGSHAGIAGASAA